MTLDLARAPLPLELPGPKRPSKEYLLGFRDSMIDRYRDRNDDFDTLVNAWHGSYYALYARAWNMDSAGKPILRVTDRSMQDVPTTVNIYKGFVDAYKRMLVGLPDIRMPRPAQRFPSTLEGQKQGEEWSEHMKRAAYGFWAASQMDVQQVMNAWWLTVCGSHGLIVWPDFKRGHAVIRNVAPWDIYGVGKLGDPVALSRCIVSVEEDQMVVGDEFPDLAQKAQLRESPLISPAGGGDMASQRGQRATRHDIYLDENWFVRMIGDEIVDADYHGLGFCPALIPPLILLPGYVNRGHSVAEQALPMQLSINYAVSVWEYGMKDAIYKTAWVKDPINVPDNWARGKGQLITVSAEGAVGEFGGDPQALKIVRDHYGLMREFMEINTGVSPAALRGQLTGGGPTTGRGIEKSMGPYLAANEEVQTVQSLFMARALAYCFAMTANADFWEDSKDAQVHFTGLIKRKPIDESFSRVELASVTMPEIIFAPMAHLGLHERVNIALQLFNTKPPILSWQKIIEMTGLVDDIEELRSQIESDNAWRVQIMKDEVAAQQPTQPGGGGGAAPPGGPGGDEKLAAAQDAGATNADTLARAGATGARPAQPGAVPAGGAPTGNPPAGGAQGLTDQQVLDPNRLATLFKEPPPAAPPQSAGLGEHDHASLEDMMRGEIGALELVGNVELAGNTLYVDWRDKKRVTEAVAHHPEVKVRVRSKANVPKGATVVAQATKKGGRRAADGGSQEGHPGVGTQQPPQAEGKTPLA